MEGCSFVAVCVAFSWWRLRRLYVAVCASRVAYLLMFFCFLFYFSRSYYSVIARPCILPWCGQPRTASLCWWARGPISTLGTRWVFHFIFTVCFCHLNVSWWSGKYFLCKFIFNFAIFKSKFRKHFAWIFQILILTQSPHLKIRDRVRGRGGWRDYTKNNVCKRNCFWLLC